MGSGCVLSVFI